MSGPRKLPKSPHYLHNLQSFNPSEIAALLKVLNIHNEELLIDGHSLSHH